MAGAFPRPHLFISKGTHMGYSNELEVTNLLLTTNLLQQTNELQGANKLMPGGGLQAITPTFSQTGSTLTISSATSVGTIYYTNNGTTPTHSSSSISNGDTIIVSSGQTIKAILDVTNYIDSLVGTYITS